MKFFFLLFLQLASVALGQSVSLSVESLHHLKIESDSNGEEVYVVTGHDPHINFKTIESTYDHQRLSVLSFDYISLRDIKNAMVYFGPPINEQQKTKAIHLPASPKWANASFNLEILAKNWKHSKGLRLDLGQLPDQKFKLKNFCLRATTPQEEIDLAAIQKKKQDDSQRVDIILKYLEAERTAHISKIWVKKHEILIFGNKPAGESFQLLELPIYTDPLNWKDTRQATPVSNEKNFEIRLPRYLQGRDRLYSRWALFNHDKQISAFRYTDQIDGARSLAKHLPASKKGLGVSWRNDMMDDLLALGIKNITVNIVLNSLLRLQESKDTQRHLFTGKHYFISQSQTKQLDRILKFAHKHNIVVSVIVLIHNHNQGRTEEIWEHPDCEPDAHYAMPNLNSPEGVLHYTAALDYLASRYTREDQVFGRISNWIIHNEVDCGVVWTNAGDKQMESYTELYYRSMRIAHLTTRKYDPHARVFGSFTHFWNETVNPRYYHPKAMLELLNKLSKTEKDFEWGVAYHPYPKNLRDPRAWKNQNSTFSFETPLITMSNIEVLDAWVKKPENRFHGNIRGVLLSEQGLNSPDYSPDNLHLQAAGFAYFWNKVKHLDSIEAFQYHRWVDHGNEGGLKLGLWTLKPGTMIQADQKKPIWEVFKAAGTKNETQVFEKFKATIGVESWQQVEYKGNIKEE